ncbi:MAG: AhpC/TSA family protein [Chitinophagaceae bacterium]|nr:AhpC/TSA family protein [Chitinophagaceae bacterium]
MSDWQPTGAGVAQALLDRLSGVSGMAPGRRRLVVLVGQLGDFDSLEYAQALAAVLPRLETAGIGLLVIGIGHEAGAERFCAYTGLPRTHLQVDWEPLLHRQLGLYAGLQSPAGPWPALLLMCAGIGSPGTLAEVLRGYSGDRQAPQRLDLPLFNLVGRGYLRPFELATVRLRNMVEVLGHWRTYVPSDAHLTQRGGTVLLEADNSVLYSHRDAGILGFSATMAQPLSFLDPYLPLP